MIANNLIVGYLLSEVTTRYDPNMLQIPATKEIT